MKKIAIATGALLTLVLSGLSVFAQSQPQSREDLVKAIEAKRAELSALENLLLSPSEEDQANYAEFLRQPDTGLIRLLPREKYDSTVYRKNTKGITISGGGAYYSFARKTHEWGYGNDIGLEAGKLDTVAYSGTLLLLGDVPLESVSLESPVAQTLASPSSTDNARNRSQVSAKSNTTYLLRSFDDTRSDLLVAFRVVRVDTDGSAIILWKLLKSFPLKQMAEKD